MTTQAPVSIMPEHMQKACPSNATQRNATQQTNATLPRHGRTPLVPNAPRVVDNDVSLRLGGAS